MRETYVRLMARLQWLCFFWCGIALVSMVILIFTGVVMRYGFARGARFAEPMSIFFAVQLTMYGAAACYRANVHLRLAFFVQRLPKNLAYFVDRGVQVLLAILAVSMIYFGYNLAATTWFQAYPEFEHIRVGVVYAAIPLSGMIFLLFVLEHLFFGRQGVDFEEEELARAVAQAEQAEQAEQQASG
ncbi:MAG: TRAP transporter small permease [Alphaproteobacteria bacterium]